MEFVNTFLIYTYQEGGFEFITFTYSNKVISTFGCPARSGLRRLSLAEAGRCSTSDSIIFWPNFLIRFPEGSPGSLGGPEFSPIRFPEGCTHFVICYNRIIGLIRSYYDFCGYSLKFILSLVATGSLGGLFPGRLSLWFFFLGHRNDRAYALRKFSPKSIVCSKCSTILKQVINMNDLSILNIDTDYCTLTQIENLYATQSDSDARLISKKANL
ncbi:hypothetical protein H8356DRAFT_1344905 [Neocallimastix lanati (nom. inval.)]|nr:hypothetical protein H8356DRAFT_1344905 [Neocallimastix sp. JGI-2020a]